MSDDDRRLAVSGALLALAILAGALVIFAVWT